MVVYITGGNIVQEAMLSFSSVDNTEDVAEFAQWSGSENDVYSTKPPDGFSQLEDAALSLDQLQEAFKMAQAQQEMPRKESTVGDATGEDAASHSRAGD